MLSRMQTIRMFALCGTFVWLTLLLCGAERSQAQSTSSVSQSSAAKSATLSDSAAARTAGLNVLMILADDMRPDLSTYGSVAKTPNLAALASRSVQFDRAYAQQSLCNPSRSSMLTGLRPDTLGLWSNGTHFRELQPDVITLPQWFKQQGYTARCVGKVFHNWHTRERGDPRSWSALEFLHYANHADDLPQVQGQLPPNHAKAPKCECFDVPDEAYYDGRIANEAIRVLNEVRGEPFFLAVGFWKPHAPFNAPKAYWDMYNRATLPGYHAAPPRNAPPIAAHDGRELRGSPPNQLTFTAEQAAEMRHGYLANISYMDAQLGKVLKALDASGVADRTVIIFAGDHGYHLGEHALWAKTSNYDLDTRVPLMISVPGKTSVGQRTTCLAELVDLFPTLVDACGLRQPQRLDGISLMPVVTEPARQLKAAAFHQHPRPAYYDREPTKTPLAMGYGVRTDRVHYIEWREWSSDKIVAQELYDLATDPDELENRYGQASLAEVQRQAAELLSMHLSARPAR